MQLKDPFHSVWSSESGSNWAYFTIYVAGFSAFVYFVFLVYKIGRAWKAIQNKRAQLYRLKELNRLKVQGVIYRFKFLFLFTLACAALTFIGYVMKQACYFVWLLLLLFNEHCTICIFICYCK